MSVSDDRHLFSVNSKCIKINIRVIIIIGREGEWLRSYVVIAKGGVRE